MRLIDADIIDFNIAFGGENDFAKDLRSAADRLIKAQPTACDVDKVVEAVHKECIKMSPANKPGKYYKAIGIRECEAIIRNLGECEKALAEMEK